MAAHLLGGRALADDVIQRQPRLGAQQAVHELMHLGHGAQRRDEGQGVALLVADDAQAHGDIVLLAVHLETGLHIVQLFTPSGSPGNGFGQRDAIRQGAANDQGTA